MTVRAVDRMDAWAARRVRAQETAEHTVEQMAKQTAKRTAARVAEGIVRLRSCWQRRRADLVPRQDIWHESGLTVGVGYRWSSLVVELV